MNTKRKVTSHMCGIVFMDPRYKNVYNVNSVRFKSGFSAWVYPYIRIMKIRIYGFILFEVATLLKRLHGSHFFLFFILLKIFASGFAHSVHNPVASSSSWSPQFTQYGERQHEHPHQDMSSSRASPTVAQHEQTRIACSFPSTRRFPGMQEVSTTSESTTTSSLDARTRSRHIVLLLLVRLSPFSFSIRCNALHVSAICRSFYGVIQWCDTICTKRLHHWTQNSPTNHPVFFRPSPYSQTIKSSATQMEMWIWCSLIWKKSKWATIRSPSTFVIDLCHRHPPTHMGNTHSKLSRSQVNFRENPDFAPRFIRMSGINGFGTHWCQHFE